jgi:hypothetical protein
LSEHIGKGEAKGGCAGSSVLFAVSELGKKLAFSTLQKLISFKILYPTAAMATRRQIRLLQSILALGENGSTGRVVRRERVAGCLKSTAPATRRPANSSHASSRHFTTSSFLSKKGKASKDTPKAIERLKEALTKTRSAGRISPETIENLPVQLNIKHESGASGKDRKESGRLGDYATVVPKGGRVMQVFVAEESVCLFPPYNLPMLS